MAWADRAALHTVDRVKMIGLQASDLLAETLDLDYSDESSALSTTDQLYTPRGS